MFESNKNDSNWSNQIFWQKNKQNEAQYGFAFSSNNLDKYVHLTGEVLDYKPSDVEKSKFEYSAFGKIFNKGLKEKDKKEGLLKRLKNIEDKNGEWLNTIK